MSRMAKSTLPPLPADETIVRKSSGEHAALHLRKLIFDGHLKPGARVPQYEVAEALGISRIPLREALVALEREGWVTLEMHRGAFVNALDEQMIRDHYELFGLVYGFAVKLAIERAGADLIDRLSTIEADFRAETDPVKAGAIVLKFHIAVVDAAKSNRIKVVLRAMSTVVPGDFFEEVPASVDVERKSVPAILRAIKKGDGDKAALEYGRMMRRLGDEVVDVLRERGLFGES
jgi:DNA-binding GntR family transcriptional regulator